MKKNKKNLLIGLILISILFFIFLLINDSGGTGSEVYYTVNQGSTSQMVSEELEELGVISNADKLNKMFIKDEGYVYGDVTYVLQEDMDIKDVYKIISSPISNLKAEDSLVIFEGEKLEQIAQEVSVLLSISKDEVLDYWSDESNLKNWINEYPIISKSVLEDDVLYPLEGYLYPATYPIYGTEDLESITQKILSTTQTKYEEYYNSKNSSGLNFHESLTLASIVERETMYAEDKPIVAEVFYNRIDAGMPLQSDITVLYAMGVQKSYVSYEDLEYNSPYNTYLNEGIPPGPIASVSLESIDAVYNPDNNDYLYFFAKQDTGEVIYSKTLEEHERVSAQYAWE